MMNVIKLKSWEEYFEVEVSGKKNNTCRYVHMWEKKYQALAAMKVSGQLGRVQLYEVTREGEATGREFVKQITDITFWDKYVIISWGEE